MKHTRGVLLSCRTWSDEGEELASQEGSAICYTDVLLVLPSADLLQELYLFIRDSRTHPALPEFLPHLRQLRVLCLAYEADDLATYLNLDLNACCAIGALAQLRALILSRVHFPDQVSGPIQALLRLEQLTLERCLLQADSCDWLIDESSLS